MASLTIPALDSAPFSLTVRQDVVDAVLADFLPPEEIMVLLDYVVSLDMGQRMKPPLLHHGNFLNQRGCEDPEARGHESPVRLSLNPSCNGVLPPSPNSLSLTYSSKDEAFPVTSSPGPSSAL